MEWIHSIDEIQQYLREDEEILWSRKTIENLRSSFSFLIKIGIGTIIIATVLYFIFLLVHWTFSLLILVGSISIIVMLIIFGIRANNKLKTIQLDRVQQMEYEYFDILTSQRFIKKDYTENYVYKKKYEKYSNNVLEQIGDVIFVELNSFNIIDVDFFFNKVWLLIFQGSYDFFFVFDQSEKEGVRNTINKLTKKYNFEIEKEQKVKEELLEVIYRKKD